MPECHHPLRWSRGERGQAKSESPGRGGGTANETPSLGSYGATGQPSRNAMVDRIARQVASDFPGNEQRTNVFAVEM
jgi:hypothetical protein